MPSIRRFEPDREWAAVGQLWQQSLPRWPLDAATLQRVVAGRRCEPDDMLVADVAGRLGGLISTQLHDVDDTGTMHGCIRVLIVAPELRRTGLGTALYRAAIELMKQRHVRRVQLGTGEPRLWPGVPVESPSALAFFGAHGWQYDHQVADMIGDLRPPEIETEMRASAARRQISFGLLQPDGVSALLAFEQREFPEWAAAFGGLVDAGDTDDVLVGYDASGQVIASQILYTPRTGSDRLDVLWTLPLGKDTGALGCVGVAEQLQGTGIGSALVAYGMELLRERGMRQCFLGWVWAVDFYRRLGFREWQVYAMSTRDGAEL